MEKYEEKLKVFIPPIKTQGIKSKLVNWIKENIQTDYIFIQIKYSIIGDSFGRKF